MRPPDARRCWSLALALTAAAGCGAFDMGSENGKDGGAAGTDCACLIILSTHTPAPGDVVVAEVSPIAGVGPFSYEWSVTYATGAGVAVTPRDTAGTQVDIPIAAAGSYQVVVDQTTGSGAGCRATESILARNPTGTSDQVLLRFVPPPASGIPVQQKKLAITGGTPQGDLNFTLESGIPLQLPVLADDGASAAAFVRLTANDKGFETAAYVSAGAPVTVNVLDDSYDILVIPDEGTTKRFAPTLALNQALYLISGSGARLRLDPGVEVTGSVTDAGGTPVTGARVVLSRGRLPSTLGTVAADGTFSVRVQSGDGFGLSVSAPETTGLPDLELPTGLTVAAPGGAFDVAYAATVQAHSDLVATVTSHASAQVVAGARVTLRGLIDVAGTVTVGSSVVPVPGVVRRVATTAGDGVVSFAALPPGDYDVVIEPLGHGLADDATTRTRVTLPTAAVSLSLFPKVTLSGTLQRPADLATRDLTGTRVRAILRVGGDAPPALGAAPVTAADAGGTFGVRVDPADPEAPVEYALIAEPPAASGLARGMRVVQVHGLGDVDLSPLPLPRGLLLAGVVTPEYGAPLAGVYVEAYRYREPGQEDPAARAECITDADGRFSLVFSDPDDTE